MALTEAQKFLITEMKKLGIDKETSVATSIHLKTKSKIRLMWNWMNTLEHIPSQEEVLSQVAKIIKER